MGGLRDRLRGVGWGSASEVGDWMGWSHSTVTGRLERLEEWGWMQVQGGKWLRRWRWVDVPEASDAAQAGSDEFPSRVEESSSEAFFEEEVEMDEGWG